MNRLLLCVLFAFIADNALATSFRCGRTLIKVGESSNALIKKCGSPSRKYASKETISDHGRQKQASVSNWIYERRGKKDMIVSLSGGAVIKIQVD